jgi:hypothetical protein
MKTLRWTGILSLVVSSAILLATGSSLAHPGILDQSNPMTPLIFYADYPSAYYSAYGVYGQGVSTGSQCYIKGGGYDTRVSGGSAFAYQWSAGFSNPDYWPYDWSSQPVPVATDNITVYEVWAVLVQVGIGTRAEGFMSIANDCVHGSNDAPQTWATWHNSTNRTYTTSLSMLDIYGWNVTDMFAWNASMLISVNTAVLFTFDMNSSYQFFDYLGLWYVWTHANTSFPEEEEVIPVWDPTVFFTGGAIAGLFGIIGGVGLVASPAMFIKRWHESDNRGIDFVIFLAMMALFFGFLLIGLYAI